MQPFSSTKKLALVWLTVALAIISVCRPASAAVTARFSIVGPNPVVAPCPVNVSFTGSISGPPGPVTYFYSWFVNGAPHGSSTFRATIPASGTLTLQDPNLTLAIDQAHSGLQSYEVDVQTPNAAQGKVFFTVNCQAAPPPGIKNIVSESPANVVAIGDLASCTNRAPSMACGFILADSTASKSLVLGWDVAKVILIGHHPGTIPGPADGFKVYRVDGGRKDYITKQPFENTRVSEIPKPSDGSYLGKCYAVTAYNALAESEASKPYCIGMTVPAFHTVLRPTQWASRYQFHQRSSLPSDPAPQCSDLCVGWEHDAANGTDLGWQHAVAWRGYLLFSPSAIRGIHATRATLKLLNSGDSGCVDKVSRANADWWDTGSWIDGAFGHESVGPSAENSSGAVFDVTLAVWLWASGAEPNNGFVITGRNEDTGANDTTHCISHFKPSAVLDIEQ